MKPKPMLLTLALFVSGLSCYLACERPSRGGGGDDDSAEDEEPTAVPVDMLWVVDNSNSMAAIQDALQQAMPVLMTNLAGLDIDFRAGVTTTDIESSGNGNQGNIRSLGAIGGLDCQVPQIVTPTASDLEGEFSQLLGVGVTGSGNETGLLAAAYALCKGMGDDFWAGLAERPDTDPVKEVCGTIPESDQTCNEDFFREGATAVVVIVSDEGDDTYRSADMPPSQVTADCMGDGALEECDCRLNWFMEFFESMPRQVTFVTVGPTYTNSETNVTWCDGSVLTFDGPCNPFGAAVCSIDFYQQAACLTGGLFSPIQVTSLTNDPSTCGLTDFDPIAKQLTALLTGN